jgi:hypothetical protein
MMDWPQTRRVLENKGWTFERRGFCSGKTCHRTIEWWRDNAGKWIPLEQAFKTDPTQLVPHHKLCPNVNEFKSKPVAEKPEKLSKQQEAVKKRTEKAEVPQGRLF